MPIAGARDSRRPLFTSLPAFHIYSGLNRSGRERMTGHEASITHFLELTHTGSI